MPSLDPKMQEKMADTAHLVGRVMEKLLPKTDLAERQLFDAMRHSTLAGGKRLRPFMVKSSAKLFGVADDCWLRTAAAVEFLHCYSLVHDDLPAMDNSDLRRGQPTTHKKFDEATAILAGDALLTYAFEILVDPATHEDPKIRCALVHALAKAAGGAGMVGGQMLDLLAEKTKFDIGTVTRLQRMKTGEIIAFSAQSGAILGRAAPPQRQALSNYAHDLGIAFQIVDDLLDAEGTEAQTGKSVGRDAAAGKATFVSILGASVARERAHMLVDQAISHLRIFEGRANDLEQVAHFVVSRQS